MKYKLRFYIKNGTRKGNLDREEFFATKEEMDARYKEVFVYNDFALNPTAWVWNGAWERIAGY